MLSFQTYLFQADLVLEKIACNLWHHLILLESLFLAALYVCISITNVTAVNNCIHSYTSAVSDFQLQPMGGTAFILQTWVFQVECLITVLTFEKLDLISPCKIKLKFAGVLY